ncbi:MAG TPA: lysylphosphatidylglycerol synthase transmembrane domain-containing protein [Jatrophihabitans sp.]
MSPSSPRSEAGSVRIRSVLGRLAPVARPVFAVLIFLAIGYAVVSEWQGVRSALLTLDWPSVMLSFLAAFAGTVSSLMAWRALLADEGHPLPVLVAGRIFFVGQLGKYLPGSVWSIVMQMELAKSAGVQRGRAFTTSLAWVGLSLSTALCMGVLGFPVLASAHAEQVWVLVALLPFALVASAPPVLTRLVNLVLRVMRKGPLPKALSWRGVLTACGWLASTWVLFGLHLWLLANALGAPGLSGITRCIGGFALAMAAGVVFVFAPSGAGVREALIVAALAPVMTPGQALGIAVVSRALFILADVGSAGAAALSGARRLRGTPAAVPPNAPDETPLGSEAVAPSRR